MADCYRVQYGEECDALFAAMLKEREKVALKNPFADHHPHLKFEYFLDESSLIAPTSLPIPANGRVLDMCSAPGGKLLAMVFRQIINVDYVACDISSARCERLRTVLKSYLPEAFIGQHLTIKNADACQVALKNPASFDAVLLDAPCSSEAHVINNDKLLKKFSGLRKSLPIRQYALLAAGLLALKPGGFLVYATCSINQNENQGVIQKLIKKKGDQFSVERLEHVCALHDEFGLTVLPHLHKAGPAFISLLRKN